MLDQSKDEETIFKAAAKLQTPAERIAYVRNACGNDSTLLARLTSLLEVHSRKSNLLDVLIPDPDVVLDDSPISEGPGTTIGRYKLLEKIGEGGMAVVYMAEQQEPIRRKVALKIIKLGMDTKSVIARFEAERQALAMMDHPNIAKVLDAGATETGRPYFVMELVKGVSITDYCDANSLSTKERLELFIQVCNAVQHAHQKGIIHRDIKPTNVMVTLHDGKPVPKVIDFGIAKAINQKLTEKTLFTRYAHIIGTPAYMSPEQAELSDLDIDTRTDIYSLGVLLYELLTGTTPFGEEELRKAGYIEMQRVIREQEPAKPSTKLSTLGKTLTDVAKHRSATPDVLRKAVRGDLDWIVMKSLEKDRARRYETANGLALDLRRHIEHEPVLARGPSTTYRLHKFLRRHRSQTVAALAMVIVAAAGTMILSMWNRDRLQLTEAEGFRHRGILSQAREQYAKADREAALETIKPILDSRHVGSEAQLLYAGILVDNRRSDEAVAVLGNLLNERPEIAGAAHSLLARILWESESSNAIVGATPCGCPIHRPALSEAEGAATQGRPYDAIDDHRRQAEALLPETAEAYFLRAMFAITIKEQLTSLDRALQLDPTHYESRRLRAFTYYASRKYDKMKDDALVMTILRPRDPLGCSLRAIALRELGKYAEAIAEYDNALARTPKTDPQYSDLSAQRCETLLRMGDYERVIADAQECLKLSPDKPASVAGGVEGVPPSNRGQDARDTMDALDTQDFSHLQYYIFSALTALGEYDEANTVFQQIVSRTPTARNEFREWCAKYVFDTLEAGRSWHPVGHEPAGATVSRASRPRSEGGTPSAQRGQDGRDTMGAAFLPMVEAEETYRALCAKARRLTTEGFSARWSPDGKKLAFSLGVQGYSGVAIYDPTTKETDLLIVPGKDPTWSPDGKYIAFVRDCQVLRLEELTATEGKNQDRPVTDEEVWVMNADGTQPRRLARGGWPSWSADSTHVYFHSRLDNTLCSISIVGQDAEPKRIMACSSWFPSVSPDNERVAYVEYQSLKVMDLTTQTSVAEWRVPFGTWGGPVWSPTGNELCLGAGSSVGDRTGLWIYRLDGNEPVKILDSQIMAASWAPDGTKLAFGLRPPYFELWAADVDPSVSTIESLGSAQTLDEHWQDMLRLYTRRIETDPQDAYAYSDRARYYDYLKDREEAKADMRRWSAIVSGSDLPVDTPRPRRFASPNEAAGVRRVINGPFNYKIVFSAERPVNETPILNIALGQKGRCNMKSFKMPILSTRGLAMSLLGLCLLSGLDTPAAHADFTFGEPVSLQSVIPMLDPVHDAIFSCTLDGLEMYVQSDPGRPGGQGGYDLWVLKRDSIDADWGPLENLGPAVNGPQLDGFPSISADGLTLYFYSNRSGGYGGEDLYIGTRATRNAPWGQAVNMGPKVNSPQQDTHPRVAPDNLELYFISARPGGYGGFDIYICRRATASDPWGDPVNLGPVVNSAYHEAVPNLSADGLLLAFSDFPGSLRPGGYGGMDVWMSRRATVSSPWQTAVHMGPPVNSPQHDAAQMFSPDGFTLYLFSTRSGGADNYQAAIIPIVDFNGDGVVDIADVFIMLEHWLTDHPLCDIGPMPWGDGFVDAQDLIVLAEHIANNPGDANDVQ